MRYRWLTFGPEWLTGSPNLDTSNALYLWVYLVVRVLALYYTALTLHVVSDIAVHEHDVSEFRSAENLVLIIVDIIQMGRGTTLADS